MIWVKIGARLFFINSVIDSQREVDLKILIQHYRPNRYAYNMSLFDSMSDDDIEIIETRWTKLERIERELEQLSKILLSLG